MTVRAFGVAILGGALQAWRRRGGSAGSAGRTISIRSPSISVACGGDWTNSGLNAGCIEAAVLSGLQAANAMRRPQRHRIADLLHALAPSSREVGSLDRDARLRDRRPGRLARLRWGWRVIGGKLDGIEQDPFAEATVLGVLEDRDRKYLVDHSRMRRIHRGQILFSEGEASDSVLVLISGHMNVLTYSREGSEFIVNSVLPGDTIGEVGVLSRAPVRQPSRPPNRASC